MNENVRVSLSHASCCVSFYKLIKTGVQKDKQISTVKQYNRKTTIINSYQYFYKTNFSF